MSLIANASTANANANASTANASHPGRHSVLAAGQEANHLPNPFPTFDILTDAAATQQERAVVMSTRGMRSSQIALALGVPPRTVRHWLARFRKHMAAERQAELAESLDQAIESYRAILVAAWESYESEQRIEHAILTGQLDRTRRRRIIQSPRHAHRTALTTPTDLSDLDTASDAEASETILEETETPRRTNHGARYLSIALAAQREITRLQGLYDRDRRPPADIRLTVVERPAPPDDQPPALASSQPAPAPAPEPTSSAPSPALTPTPTPSSPAPSPLPVSAQTAPRPSAIPPSAASRLSSQGERPGMRISLPPLPPLPPIRHHPPLNPASFQAYRL